MIQEPTQEHTREILKSMPPEVRRWLSQNFTCFRIDGFDLDGRNVELYMVNSCMQKWAMLESLRRTIDLNTAGPPMLTLESTDDEEGDDE